MPDFVTHKGQRTSGTFERHYGTKVKEVQYSPSTLTRVILSDGRTGTGSCLGCDNIPCIEKNSNELVLFGKLDSFPGDPNRDVCPTGAIKWNYETAYASISQSKCIGCGLCVSRCPYGAISLVDGLFAYVEKSDSYNLISIQERSSNEHPTVKRSGQIASLNSQAAKNLPYTIGNLDDTHSTLMVRNLFHEIGLNARTRRRGDTNMRIDAVGFTRNEKPFVAEIETTAALESPRALLEDVAILHSRYGYTIDNIEPLSIVLTFPSIRSEYYNVIRDIEKVLGIRCRTITIGALIALLWNNQKIDGFENDYFTIGEEEVSISHCIGIAEEILIEPYPGAFKPAK